MRLYSVQILVYEVVHGIDTCTCYVDTCKYLYDMFCLFYSSRVWWRFAIDCVIRDIKEYNERLSVAFITTRARQCVSYVSAYTVHLTNATPSETIKRTLSTTEESLNYEEIVILRRLAMQRVEKERALVEV